MPTSCDCLSSCSLNTSRTKTNSSHHFCWLTQNFELGEVGECVHVGSAQVSAEVVSARMLRANIANEKGAVPLVQVSQQLGAAFVALVHHVRARLEDDRREELRVRLAKVPDAVDATVRPDPRWVDERARDDHTGVSHGRNVPRHPNVPLATGILVGIITGEH